MATLTVYPVAGAASPMDGYVQRDLGAGAPESFATITAAAGNGSGASVATDRIYALDAGSTTDNYKRVNRSIFCFDTSALTSGASISAAVLSIEGTFKNNSLGDDAMHIVAATPASTSAIANSDFSQLGSTSFSNIAYASISTTGYNDFTLDSNGIANISLTGISKFGVKGGWDRSGTMSGTWSSGANTRFEGKYADTTGTTSDPKLVITYTTGGAATPKNLTLLGVG